MDYDIRWYLWGISALIAFLVIIHIHSFIDDLRKEKRHQEEVTRRLADVPTQQIHSTHSYDNDTI